jgi:hypothetical protein
MYCAEGKSNASKGTNNIAEPVCEASSACLRLSRRKLSCLPTNSVTRPGLWEGPFALAVAGSKCVVKPIKRPLRPSYGLPSSSEGVYLRYVEGCLHIVQNQSWVSLSPRTKHPFCVIRRSPGANLHARSTSSRIKPTKAPPVWVTWYCTVSSERSRVVAEEATLDIMKSFRRAARQFRKWRT